MSSSNSSSKKDEAKKDETKKDGKDDEKGYESPVEDGQKGELKQCEACNCWHDDRGHKCEPEEKDKYAKGT